MATTQGVPITLALVVAAPLCWGVIAAKPPRIAFLQLSGALHGEPFKFPCLEGKQPHNEG